MGSRERPRAQECSVPTLTSTGPSTADSPPRGPFRVRDRASGGEVLPAVGGARISPDPRALLPAHPGHPRAAGACEQLLPGLPDRGGTREVGACKFSASWRSATKLIPHFLDDSSSPRTALGGPHAALDSDSSGEIRDPFPRGTKIRRKAEPLARRLRCAVSSPFGEAFPHVESSSSRAGHLRRTA